MISTFGLVRGALPILNRRSSAPLFQSRLTCHDRVLPSSRGRNELVDLIWSPGAGLVIVDRGAGLQHRINDPPRLFHIVLAGEQRGVSGHGVSEKPLVS